MEFCLKSVMYTTLLHRYYEFSNSNSPTLTHLKTLLHCPNQRTRTLSPLSLLASSSSSSILNSFNSNRDNDQRVILSLLGYDNDRTHLPASALSTTTSWRGGWVILCSGKCLEYHVWCECMHDMLFAWSLAVAALCWAIATESVMRWVGN